MTPLRVLGIFLLTDRRMPFCYLMDCSLPGSSVQSMEFSRQELWSGLLFPSPGDCPNPGIEPRSPALQADSLPSEPLGKAGICLQSRRHRRRGFNPWVGTIPWRRAWQTTPVFLPRESHVQRSLASYSLWGCKESDRAKHFTFFNC